jgi:hypothetical protein
MTWTIAFSSFSNLAMPGATVRGPADILLSEKSIFMISTSHCLDSLSEYWGLTTTDLARHANFEVFMPMCGSGKTLFHKFIV